MKHDTCHSCSAYRAADYDQRGYCEFDMPGFPFAGSDCDLYTYEPGSDVEEDDDD